MQPPKTEITLPSRGIEYLACRDFWRRALVGPLIDESPELQTACSNAFTTSTNEVRLLLLCGRWLSDLHMRTPARSSLARLSESIEVGLPLRLWSFYHNSIRHCSVLGSMPSVLQAVAHSTPELGPLNPCEPSADLVRVTSRHGAIERSFSIPDLPQIFPACPFLSAFDS